MNTPPWLPPANISRREFIHMLAVALASMVVHACAPIPAPTAPAGPGNQPIQPTTGGGSVLPTAEKPATGNWFFDLVARKANLDPEMLQKLVETPANNEMAKLIKVALIPERDIFVNEFGREPVQEIYFDPVTMDSLCSILDDMSFLVIDGYTSSCDSLSSCGTNDCVGQNCPKLDSCDKNTCSVQNCPNNPSICGFADFTSAEVIAVIESDPFIQALYQMFQVAEPASLTQILQQTLAAERVTVADLQEEHNLEKLAQIEAFSVEANALKALLIPNLEVYQNIYGREPIFEPIIQDGILEGFENYGPLDELDFRNFGHCGENDCGFQTCTDLDSCGTNTCGEKQNCPNLKSCETMKSIVTAEMLEEMQGDPFVNALFEEFGTTSPPELARELTQLLEVRRSVNFTPIQTIYVNESPECPMHTG